MKPGLPTLNGRRELICLALAAAEACCVAPLFLAVSYNIARHSPLLLWIGMLVLLLGFFYFYRALALANLSLRRGRLTGGVIGLKCALPPICL